MLAAAHPQVHYARCRGMHGPNRDSSRQPDHPNISSIQWSVLSATVGGKRYVGVVAKITPLRPRPHVLEFFAGIGLARMGLEAAGFAVSWANDYEPDKFAMYAAHHQDRHDRVIVEGGLTTHVGPTHTFAVGDIAAVKASELPKGASLAWASSPCTDLSLAGSRGGLSSGESNAFWAWTRVLRDMGANAPDHVVLENVIGLATSHGGEDLRAAIRELNSLGYSVDLLSLDARRFVPQSRPRMFVVGTKTPPEDDPVSSELRPAWVQPFYGDESLRMHRAPLPAPPKFLLDGFSAQVEDIPLEDERWWDAARLEAFVESLSPTQRGRIDDLKRRRGVHYRTAYRRTRNGKPVWEVRADDVAGCLRTARGGSSKQAVVRIGHGQLKVRWMTPLEYARLMGAGDFKLEGARNSQALYAFGDAVAVPAVEWLGRNYLMPLVKSEIGTHRAVTLATCVQ